ncbi:hypothetical protein A2110_02855 [Candidatus Jorgensenbacteria bacterium GWA1_54_12]|uniref:EamA domain-containing protein n=1 Tax=Candidatus Jorgensenbacteria bacterium GWA1_54_12 TaxID=1798468 RepID=A0A1F6BKR4_9BACT|nr:MAG: hypothetical protein A2110_02855 [Candidatus Jorgensenbacteria bacterium GWA1_54_12]
MLAYFALAFGILCNGAANIFAKKAAKFFTEAHAGSLKEMVPVLFTNANMFVSLALYGFAFVAYIFSLGRIDLHIAYPTFVSATTILVTISSVVIFGEKVTLLNVFGIALVLGGIFLLTR